MRRFVLVAIWMFALHLYGLCNAQEDVITKDDSRQVEPPETAKKVPEDSLEVTEASETANDEEGDAGTNFAPPETTSTAGIPRSSKSNSNTSRVKKPSKAGKQPVQKPARLSETEEEDGADGQETSGTDTLQFGTAEEAILPQEKVKTKNETHKAPTRNSTKETAHQPEDTPNPKRTLSSKEEEQEEEEVGETSSEETLPSAERLITTPSLPKQPAISKSNHTSPLAKSASRVSPAPTVNVPGGPSFHLEEGALPPVLARANQVPQSVVTNGAKLAAPSRPTGPPTKAIEEVYEDVEQNSEQLPSALISAVNEEYAMALKNLSLAGLLTEGDYGNKYLSDLFALLLENEISANPSNSEKDQIRSVHKAAVDFQTMFISKAATTKNVSEIVSLLNEQILFPSASETGPPTTASGTAIPSKLLNQTAQSAASAATLAPTGSTARQESKEIETPVPWDSISTEGAGEASLPKEKVDSNSLQTLHLLRSAGQNGSLAELNSDNEKLNRNDTGAGNPQAKTFPGLPSWEVLGGENRTTDERVEEVGTVSLPNFHQVQSTGALEPEAGLNESTREAEADHGISVPVTNGPISDQAGNEAANETGTIASIQPISENIELDISSTEPITTSRLSPSVAISTGGSASGNVEGSATSELVPGKVAVNSASSPAEEGSSTIQIDSSSSTSLSSDSISAVSSTDSVPDRTSNPEPEPEPEPSPGHDDTSDTIPVGEPERRPNDSTNKSTTAEPHAVLIWSFKIVDPEIEWDTELTNKESFQYKTLIGNLVPNLKMIFRKLEPERFVGLSVKRFREGNRIIAEGETELKESVESLQLLDNFLKILREQKNKIGGRVIDPLSVYFDGRPSMNLVKASSNSTFGGTPVWVIGTAVGCALLIAIIIAVALIIVRQRRNSMRSASENQITKSASPSSPSRQKHSAKMGAVAHVNGYDPIYGARADYYHYQLPYGAPMMAPRPQPAPPSYYSPYYRQGSGHYSVWS